MSPNDFEQRMHHLKQSYEQLPTKTSRRKVKRRLKKENRRMSRWSLQPLAYAAALLLVLFIGSVFFINSDVLQPQQSASKNSQLPESSQTVDHQSLQRQPNKPPHQSNEVPAQYEQEDPSDHRSEQSRHEGNHKAEQHKQTQDGNHSSSDQSITHQQNKKQETSSRKQQHSVKAVLKTAVQSLKTTIPVIKPGKIPHDAHQYVTAMTASDSNQYTVTLFQTEQPVAVNSEHFTKTEATAKLGEFGAQRYESATAARRQIGYDEVDNERVKLNEDISAAVDAGAGHVYMAWNEGRWLVEIDSPGNPKYAYDQQTSRKKVAKNIVAYLDDHFLPPPHKYGSINVSLFKNSYGITIRWQEGQIVYYVKSSQSPIAGLKMAVKR